MGEEVTCVPARLTLLSYSEDGNEDLIIFKQCDHNSCFLAYNRCDFVGLICKISAKIVIYISACFHDN